MHQRRRVVLEMLDTHLEASVADDDAVRPILSADRKSRRDRSVGKSMEVARLGLPIPQQSFKIVHVCDSSYT
jgi:hypothetical protein